MRHRYGRGTRGNPSILKFLIFFAIISSLGSLMEIGWDLLGFLIEALIILLVFGGTIAAVVAPFAAVYFLFKAIFGSKNKNKNNTITKNKTKASTVDTDALLKQLSKYFQNNDIINIDEETYLTITDKDNINLKTVDIYMREEYIGSLQDYLTAYPNAYNQLADMLTKYLNKKAKELKKNAKKAEAEIKENIAPEKKTEATVEKDADYYVKTLMYLNDQNPNEQITAGLNETCEFLRSLKKIEDEFPESKNKTGKLYEYYLPMLTDILANYNRLYANTTNQADFKASEDRLLKTIVLINGALKTISSGLLEEYYSEINVDMRTLESILKKDGLVEDFKQEG